MQAGAVSSSSNTTVSQGFSAAAGSASDPTSSLRVAALLTRKSNRLKPGTLPTGPSSTRPFPKDSQLQLDYGQEDSVSSIPAAPPAIAEPAAPVTEAEEGQVREEGEISDTEEPPAVAGSRNSSTLDVAPAMQKLRPLSSQTLALPQASLPSTKGKSKDLSQSRTVLSSSEISNVSSSPSEQHATSWNYAFEADHVRPGLASGLRCISHCVTAFLPRFVSESSPVRHSQGYCP
jgi:hypothetical protein